LTARRRVPARQVHSACFDTALGACAIAWTDAGVVAVHLPERSAAETRLAIERRTGAVEVTRPPPHIRQTIARVKRHLAGAPDTLADVAIDHDAAPPFHRRVYETLRRVGPGATVTYRELAALADSPGATRAVGQAMARNPTPILVPCHRVLAAQGKPGGFTAYGGVDTKRRMLEIEGASAALSDRRQTALGAPGRTASKALPFDPDSAVAELRARDPKLAALIDRVGPFRLELRETLDTFNALAESIVYQQLSGKAAATIFGRVRALFPRGRLSPRALADVPDDALRGAGLSAAKLAGLRDLADRALRGEVPSVAALKKMDDERIIETLTRVRGIGRWTAQMLLMFRLGRPDVLPLDDYGVLKGFGRVYGLRRDERDKGLPARARLEAHAERWRPHRSVGSWYMWRALELPGARTVR
jgi:methylated-DNA-[protein]-cysteine S-methyltransferase